MLRQFINDNNITLEKDDLLRFDLTLDVDPKAPVPYNDLYIVNTIKSKRTENFICNLETINKLKDVHNICGEICEKGTNQVVYSGINNLYTYFRSKHLSLEEEYNRLYDFIIKNNVKIYRLYDYSMIKVYKYNDTWCFSTNRGLYANNVTWRTNKSFECIFEEICAEISFDYKKELKPHRMYTFILYHPELFNRIPTTQYGLRVLTEKSKLRSRGDVDTLTRFTSVKEYTCLGKDDFIKRLTTYIPNNRCFNQKDFIGYVLELPTNGLRIKVMTDQFFKVCFNADNFTSNLHSSIVKSLKRNCDKLISKNCNPIFKLPMHNDEYKSILKKIDNLQFRDLNRYFNKKKAEMIMRKKYRTIFKELTLEELFKIL